MVWLETLQNWGNRQAATFAWKIPLALARPMDIGFEILGNDGLRWVTQWWWWWAKEATREKEIYRQSKQWPSTKTTKSQWITDDLVVRFGQPIGLKWSSPWADTWSPLVARERWKWMTDFTLPCSLSFLSFTWPNKSLLWCHCALTRLAKMVTHAHVGGVHVKCFSYVLRYTQ